MLKAANSYLLIGSMFGKADAGPCYRFKNDRSELNGVCMSMFSSHIDALCAVLLAAMVLVPWPGMFGTLATQCIYMTKVIAFWQRYLGLT